MYIPIVSQITKCIMPVGLSKIVGTLENNMKYGLYQIGSKAYLSVFKQNENTLDKGHLSENNQCNLQLIKESSQTKDTPLEVMFSNSNCKDKNAIYEIADFIVNSDNEHNIILKQAVTPHQNGTVNIFDQLYKVTNDYMFSQGDITETNGADFLGLNECTKEKAIIALQNYSTYKKKLISIKTLTNILQDTLNHLGISLDNVSPTELGKHILDQLGKAYTEATTASPINTLKSALNTLGISLDDLNPTELGKNIFNTLNKPFTDPTTTTERPNDDTNGGGTWGYVIGAVGFIAASLMVAKYGWDWYKGKNIKDENLNLKYENSKLENMKIICGILNEDEAILNVISEIGDLGDIVALANTGPLESDGYLVPTFVGKIQKLNTELNKLNSVPKLLTNLYSLGNILHNICVLLNSNDTYMAVQSFANLVKTIRGTDDSESEEYKEAREKIFDIFKVDETSSGVYHYIKEDLPTHEVPLLADVSSPSESSGIEA